MRCDDVMANKMVEEKVEEISNATLRKRDKVVKEERECGKRRRS